MWILKEVLRVLEIENYRIIEKYKNEKDLWLHLDLTKQHSCEPMSPDSIHLKFIKFFDRLKIYSTFQIKLITTEVFQLFFIVNSIARRTFKSAGIDRWLHCSGECDVIDCMRAAYYRVNTVDFFDIFLENIWGCSKKDVFNLWILRFLYVLQSKTLPKRHHFWTAPWKLFEVFYKNSDLLRTFLKILWQKYSVIIENNEKNSIFINKHLFHFYNLLIPT